MCPGGGRYVWNDKFKTMESTVYGHPGEPKHGPPAPPVLSSFATGNFGLTLEHQGLRARSRLGTPGRHKAAAIVRRTGNVGVCHRLCQWFLGLGSTSHTALRRTLKASRMIAWRKQGTGSEPFQPNTEKEN